MTQEEVKDIKMTHNEVQEGRKSIYLKTVKKENEYCNNNQEENFKVTDFDERKKNLNPIGEGLKSFKSSVITNEIATNDNSDNDTLQEDELKSSATGIKYIDNI